MKESNQPVSNLIDRSMPDTAGDSGHAIRAEAPIAKDDEGIKLVDVWKTAQRRRKLIITVSGVVFTLWLLNAVYQRVANPLFSGSSAS